MSSLKKGEKILETLKRINEEIEVDNSVAEKLKKIEEARKMPINLFPFKETREALLEELETVKEKLISVDGMKQKNLIDSANALLETLKNFRDNLEASKKVDYLFKKREDDPFLIEKAAQ